MLAVLCLQGGCVNMPLRPSTPGPEELDKAPSLPAKKAAQVCFATGDSLASAGHPAEAIGQFEKARQYDPSMAVKVTRPLALLYDAVHEDVRAEEEFKKAIALAPRDASVYNDLGYYYYNHGNWALAEQTLRKAVELEPKNQRAWNNLGLSLGEQQHYEESVAAFEKATTRGGAQCNLAFILMTQGKREEARVAFRRALELEPGMRLATTGLARLDRMDRTARQAEIAAAAQAREPAPGRPSTLPAPAASPLAPGTPEQPAMVLPPPPG
jgi:Tfp pilus assembly protein PilF